MNTQWITVREAAQLVDYTTEYVRELARQGKINSSKFGTIFMIDKADLLRYRKENPKDKRKSE